MTSRRLSSTHRLRRTNRLNDASRRRVSDLSVLRRIRAWQSHISSVYIRLFYDGRILPKAHCNMIPPRSPQPRKLLPMCPSEGGEQEGDQPIATSSSRNGQLHKSHGFSRSARAPRPIFASFIIILLSKGLCHSDSNKAQSSPMN